MSTSNQILTILAFYPGDAIQAERLCDWIYCLGGNKPSGHVLLLPDSEVHAELQMKVRLAADIAFETVSLVVADRFARIGKPERINNLIRCASLTVSRSYRLPWLWLEPDCVPLKPDWREQLVTAYYSQPKRFMGPVLKGPGKDGAEQFVLGRTAVYPIGATMDLEPYCHALGPFNVAAGNVLVDRASKCRLFQQMGYNHETDYDKIRDDAVLLHADKTGQLIQCLRAKLQAAAVPANSEIAIAPPKRRGRPPLNRSQPVTV